MAFAYTQTGFIGHDIGHRQVTRSRRGQDILGLLHGNVLMGFSYGWWVGHHNKHHSNPNHLEKDSDITRRRSIFIPEQGFTRTGRAKQFIVRHQHVLFYPLLITEGVGLRTESVKALARKLPRLNVTEACLLVLHMTLYFTAVFLLVPFCAGRRVHPDDEPAVRALHRLGLRAQPQGHADPDARRGLGLDDPPGRHLAQHPLVAT